MPCTIDIQNLRNIQRLRFQIPNRGVWLLTAGNGAGKTSLLACIRRIGHANAFPVHFPSSLQSDRLDNHSSGTVTYEINGDTVEYAYRGARWTPRPRSNSNLFDMLGYPSVIYIGATAERITPRPEDFEPRLVRAAHGHIIEAANEIFDTEKFTMLRTINLSRGTGNDVFVLSLGGNPPSYHSEKHFSLGELCVLKLLKQIRETQNNSLIIIDELEMALHPRAQVKLLRYLETQADEKSLTIIFSTHSVTLLKSTPRRNIIYLEKQDDGEIKVIRGCFPTYAIGNIAAEEESLPDMMLYVEDLVARDVTSAFFEQFSNDRFADPTLRPTAKFVPVGGFQEVIAFLERNRSVLPNHCVQKAILDGDVSTETLAQWRANDNFAQLEKFRRLEDDINYLPFTPEEGMLDYMSDNLPGFEQALRIRCGDNQIRIGNIVRRFDRNLQGAARRSAAKRVLEELIDYIMQRTQRTADAAREHLCGVFATSSWQTHRPEFMRLFGRML